MLRSILRHHLWIQFTGQHAVLTSYLLEHHQSKNEILLEILPMIQDHTRVKKMDSIVKVPREPAIL